jgi:hypothetical protein
VRPVLERQLTGVLINPLNYLLCGAPADERRLQVRRKDDWGQGHADGGNGLKVATARHDLVSFRSPCGRNGRMHVGRRGTRNGSR